ncbi:MAG: hypothetical protein VKK42_27495 [Lyngbya sp.]|nr:hypothetical protein [Lyngbya sp.]
MKNGLNLCDRRRTPFRSKNSSNHTLGRIAMRPQKTEKTQKSEKSGRIYAIAVERRFVQKTVPTTPWGA